ncbi:MAG: molecular chaperone DnaK [Cyanobacteria bacterium QS_8_64_29]|nr:MAG: molecular chaperone DnaK [Cyanobacteria bacterium QS_8_64_29]
MAVAIDFGTSNTAIARWNPASEAGEAVPLSELSQQLGNNPPLVPSLVYINDASSGRVTVGQAVRDRGWDRADDPRFFSGFKRGIGTEVQGFLPQLDGQVVDFERVGQWFLSALTERLDAADADSLVLTVPVDSFEAYRRWLARACQALPVERVRMLDEPTAAALGYGTTDGDVLLVLDMGGGTVDLSLVQLNLERRGSGQPLGFVLKWGERLLGERSAQRARTARTLAKAGENVGGEDIDRWLLEHFAREQALPQNALTARLVERLKVTLSERDRARENYFDDTTLDSYSLALDRPTFEGILSQQGLFERLEALTSQVLQQGRRSGIEAADIDGVLLVGGTTCIPAIRQWVQSYFPSDKVYAHRPFTATATGALQLARGIELKDFLYHSYGIRYWNHRENGHSWHPIVRAGRPYPTERPIELKLGASLENQPSIELIVGEMGADGSSRTEVCLDGNRLVTRSLEAPQAQVRPLNDREGARTIARLDPLGSPGRDRVKVQFRVDAQRTLRLTVEDLLTERVLLQDCAVVELS